MTLSFQEAFRAKQSGAISWDEYIHNLLARCGGSEHEEDNRTDDHYELLKTDPLGHSIWTWSNKVKPVKDTAPLEAVFSAYRYGTFDDVKTKLSALDPKPAEGVRGTIALLALQDRRNDVFKFCLDECFDYDRPFYDEAGWVDKKKEPELFRMLEQSEFRQHYPRNVGAPPGTAAVFDVGGRLPVDW